MEEGESQASECTGPPGLLTAQYWPQLQTPSSGHTGHWDTQHLQTQSGSISIDPAIYVTEYRS